MPSDAAAHRSTRLSVRAHARRSRSTLGLLFAAILVGACAEPEPVGPPVEGRAGLYSLLALQESMVVVEAPEDTPPEQRHIRTGDGTDPDREPLPCLLVRPPTRVRYQIDELPEGAVLEYSLGIRGNGFRGEGHVTFRARVGERTIFEHELDCSESVPEPERKWHAFEAPLGGGGELVLSADYEGTNPRGPFVGFARLRVSVPYQVERQRSSRSKPNVILMVVDTLRADRLSLHGHARTTSPTVDRLAAEGLWCQRAYSAAPWTIPGTASVLTGLSPPEHGLGDADSNYLSDRLDSLPRVFSREGFTTAAFTFNPLVDGSRNFDQGFEHFVNRGWAPIPEVQGEVLDWLGGIGDERFFLYLHTTDPHAPYRATAESLARQEIVKPDDIFEAQPREVLDAWYDGKLDERAKVLRTCEYYSDVYDAEVDLTDSLVARLIDVLEKSGLEDRTIFCLTSDHGEEFLDHGLIGHFNQLFEESIHVPLVLWGPGVPAGRVIDFPIENRHAAPTLLHLAGIQPPRGMRGPDLTVGGDVDALRKAGAFVTSSKGRSANFETRESADLGRMHALIDGRWHFIVCERQKKGGEGFVRLFDIEADPNCERDLSSAEPERVAAMRARIDEWLREGRASRPEMVPTTEETKNLMRSIGYIGDDD